MLNRAAQKFIFTLEEKLKWFSGYVVPLCPFYRSVVV